MADDSQPTDYNSLTPSAPSAPPPLPTHLQNLTERARDYVEARAPPILARFMRPTGNTSRLVPAFEPASPPR
ncbi:hypothetical protein QFZ34_001120 [Phyllobacterium ifriqiyense]|uniref:Uncharacterized protein n=1 Tax=Phyllobacterium ifriqiyense TaxID=314238 RepID=A0ABU0S5B1_9HYPH|nr:hypothetical protein [Phyllobacterium ifriqiyense]